MPENKVIKMSFDIAESNKIKLEKLKKSHAYTYNKLVNLAISKLKLPKSMIY